MCNRMVSPPSYSFGWKFSSTETNKNYPKIEVKICQCLV